MSCDPFGVFPPEITAQILIELYLAHAHASGFPDAATTTNKWSHIGSARLVSKTWDAHVQSIPYLWKYVALPTADSHLIAQLIARATTICQTLTLALPRSRTAHEIMLDLPRHQLAHIDSVVMATGFGRNSSDYDRWTWSRFEDTDALLKLNSRAQLRNIQLEDNLDGDDLLRMLQECTTLTNFAFYIRWMPDGGPKFPQSLKKLNIECALPHMGHAWDEEPPERVPEWVFPEGLECLSLNIGELWLTLRLPASLHTLDLKLDELRGRLSPFCARLSNLTTLTYSSPTETGLSLRHLVNQGMTHLTDLHVENQADDLLYLCHHNPGLQRITWTWKNSNRSHKRTAQRLLRYCPSLQYLKIKLAQWEDYNQSDFEYFEILPTYILEEPEQTLTDTS